jgi:hypothetical protein
METLWMVTCEVLVKPSELPSGNTKAFVNVLTWADSPQAAEGKISRYLESFEWHLIGTEDSHPIDDGRTYEGEMAEIIQKARSNPEAIILGRLFSYKVN